MGVANSNKVINMTQTGCDGSVRVTLALTAAPDILSNPTDIALVLDRSGSMSGAPLASMKEGAKTFIDIISEATGRRGGRSDRLGQPHRHRQLCRHRHRGYAADHLRGHAEKRCGRSQRRREYQPRGRLYQGHSAL